NHDQIWRSRAPLRVGVADDRAPSQSRDGPPETTDVALNNARCVDYPRRVQDRLPRPAVRWGYAIMTMWRRSQHGFQLIPTRVLTSRRRLSHARHAIAQADIASLPTGGTERHKTAD